MNRTLTITHAQSDYLAALGAEAARSASVRDAVFTAILLGHGIKGGTLVSLDGETLIVGVPESE